MTEADTIAALTNIGEVAATYTGMWLSVTFGYLTVAYFLGKSLSRFQCLAISAIYAVFAVIFAAVTIGFVDSFWLLRAREKTIIDEAWIFSSLPGYLEGTAFVLLAATLVSLYFMYNVRQREKN